MLAPDSLTSYALNSVSEFKVGWTAFQFISPDSITSKPDRNNMKKKFSFINVW